MSPLQVGKKLVALCREGRNLEAVDTLYDVDVESVEASAPQPPFERITKGLAAVREKNVAWGQSNEIHTATTEGPYPHGDDRFAVRFVYDFTNKASGMRMQLDEVAVYTLKGDKIIREEFYYDLG